MKYDVCVGCHVIAQRKEKQKFLKSILMENPLSEADFISASKVCTYLERRANESSGSSTVTVLRNRESHRPFGQRA
jgi:hypothetical protein